MKAGIMYLYHKKGEELVSVMQYACKTERDQIIKDWRKRYAKAFYNTFIQIAPAVGEGIKSDGTNKVIHNYGNRKRNYKNEFQLPD